MMPAGAFADHLRATFAADAYEELAMIQSLAFEAAFVNEMEPSMLDDMMIKMGAVIASTMDRADGLLPHLFVREGIAPPLFTIFNEGVVDLEAIAEDFGAWPTP